MGSDRKQFAEDYAGYPFQSTLPGWGATSVWSVIVDLLHISIHTPRMGSDSQSASDPKALRKYFNPRSPDGERRRMELTKRRRTSYFNPRSPDGERLQSDFQTRPNTYFNPRSPDGERQFVVSNISSHWKFQSTLPGWGATPPLAPSAQVFLVFQSTLPGWGATGARAAHTPETS